MSKRNSVLSWFLIVVYSVVLTHSISAHIHTESGTTRHIFAHESHTHSHSPHHREAHGHEGSFNLIHFIAGLFNSLTHIDIGAEHLEDYAFVRPITQPLIGGNDGLDHYWPGQFSNLINTALALRCSEVTLYEQYRPDIVQRTLTDTDPLRGPPTHLS